VECGRSLKDAALAPSTVIAGFKIIKEIGRGANGIVYLAEQTSLNREVALKILPDAKAEESGFIDAFLKEARAAARLNHPNIVQVYDAGITDEGIYFLAMELIDGKSLEDVLKEKEVLKPERAIEIAIELAKALEYSWNKEQMFHGDIKPDNVMIRKDGLAKLADFGLAKTIFEESSDEIMATPIYAPPEVIRAEHKKINCKSDMYSFGVTLYELICGQPPFDEVDCDKVLDMHLKDTHISLTKVQLGINRELSDFIDKLLSKDPEERSADWSEVVKTLEHLRKHKKKKTRKPAVKISLPLIAAVAFVVTIVTMMAAAYFHYQGKETKKTLAPETEKPGEKQNKKTEKAVEPPEKKQENEADKIQKQLLEKFQGELAEYQKILSGFSGSILDASRLRFRGLKFYNNKLLKKEDKEKLQKSIWKLSVYIEEQRFKANKIEEANLKSALRKEKLVEEQKEEKLKQVSLALAEKNKIYKVMAQFLSCEPERQIKRNFENILVKTGKMNQKLPEYKVIDLLQKMLPRKYNREAAIFENLNQLENKKLPWLINGKVYRIKGGSWQIMHLERQLSEGVFSRKKMRANQLGNMHWELLVEQFLVKGNMKLNEKYIRNTASWLLLYSREKLFKDFIKKYYPKDYGKWLQARELLLSVKTETAAYDLWKAAKLQMAELNQMAFSSIKKLKSEYSSTEVYKNTQGILADYQKKTCAIFPEAFMDKLNLDAVTLKDPDAKVFSAHIRYSFINATPYGMQEKLRNVFNEKLRRLFESEQFSGRYGIFDDVPCGKVYSWIMADAKKVKPPSFASYLPAFVDIDGWAYIKRYFAKNKDFDFSKTIIGKSPADYPFVLYSTGIIALRWQEWVMLEKVFSAFKNFYAKDKSSAYCAALYADLALKARYDTLAWEVLNQYQFKGKAQQEELLIVILRLQALLTQDDVNEVLIAEVIASAGKYFAGNDDLKRDRKILEQLGKLICSGFQTEIKMNADFIKDANYSNFYARLWLEAVARDKILQRNSIDIASVIQACTKVAGDSAFRSSLFYKIQCMNIGRNNFTPSGLRKSITEILSELKPASSASYPGFLTLLFTSYLFDKKYPPEKLAYFASEYISRCPLFSLLERKMIAILSSKSSGEKLINSENIAPLSFQKVYLWMLISAELWREGKGEKGVKKLKSFRKELRWTEKLVLDRFISLLENI
jgi:tRNA A-37 threonylcarbamoyl transferase component Bud32